MSECHTAKFRENALSRSSCETFPWCSPEIVRVLRPAKDLFGSLWSRKLHCTACHRPAPIARVDEVTSDATNASGWPNSRGAERSDGILAASQLDLASEGCMVLRPPPRPPPPTPHSAELVGSQADRPSSPPPGPTTTAVVGNRKPSLRGVEQTGGNFQTPPLATRHAWVPTLLVY